MKTATTQTLSDIKASIEALRSREAAHIARSAALPTISPDSIRLNIPARKGRTVLP